MTIRDISYDIVLRVFGFKPSEDIKITMEQIDDMVRDALNQEVKRAIERHETDFRYKKYFKNITLQKDIDDKILYIDLPCKIFDLERDEAIYAMNWFGDESRLNFTAVVGREELHWLRDDAWLKPALDKPYIFREGQRLFIDIGGTQSCPVTSVNVGVLCTFTDVSESDEVNVPDQYVRLVKDLVVEDIAKARAFPQEHKDDYAETPYLPVNTGKQTKEE